MRDRPAQHRPAPTRVALAVLLAATVVAACGRPAGGGATAADTIAGDTAAAAAAPAVDTAAIASHIHDLDQRWSQAAARHDVDAFTSFYARDGLAMPPGAGTATGPEAIANALRGLLADTTIALRFEPRTLHVGAAGDMAWEHGTWEVRKVGADVLDHGKFVVVWKNVDGEWKVAADIYNSDQPANGR